MKDMIDWLVTPPAGAAANSQPVSGDQFIPAHLAQQPAISVLACDFDGPAGREIGQRLVNDLSVNSGVLVRHLAKKLKAKGKGTLVERIVRAAETGRKWLVDTGADILLWGEVLPEGRGIRIRFLCASADADTQPGSIGLGDALDLPVDYESDMAGIIHAVVLAAIGPRKSNPQREELADLLIGPVEKLNGYIDTPPVAMEQAGLASVMTAIGNVLASMWRLKEDPVHLDRAIVAYKLALTQNYDKENPLNWALTQNQYAAALQAKSGRDKDAEPLKEAGEAYRTVAAALGAHLHVNDWALAQIHYADVQVKLSNFDNAVKHLQMASEAYQQALKVFTRETAPGPWSELMNQLGVALMRLGESVAGDRVLEQSAACFRKSLEVRRREIAPFLWAQTANNLGAVTFSIYLRGESASALHEAFACFKGASEVYAQYGHRDKAVVAQRNLDKIKQIQQAG
jgi:tetratricopeptide (TPR) repeat protein